MYLKHNIENYKCSMKKGWHLAFVQFLVKLDIGGVSLLTVPLTGYHNRKIVNCLFLKTNIRTALS